MGPAVTSLNLATQDDISKEIAEIHAISPGIPQPQLDFPPYRSSLLRPAIVNVHGGAVTIGHPPGASGTRILVTLARSLAASGQRWGVAAFYIGVGQGLAVVLENAGR
jgi:acetyl-CoA acetyltransferase